MQRVTATIEAMSREGLVNGRVEENVVMPARAFVPRWAAIRLEADGSPAALGDQIKEMVADQPDDNHASLGAIVVMAVGRSVLHQAFGLGANAYTPAESVNKPGDAWPGAGLSEAAVQARNLALDAVEPIAGRLLGVYAYNIISLAKTGHHHLPEDTGRLFETTDRLLPLAGIIGDHADSLMAVWHHMYHVVPMALKAAHARSELMAVMASRIGFDNLAMRLPVLRPNTALLSNLRALVAKASGFPAAAVALANADGYVTSVEGHLAAIGGHANAREATMHAGQVAAAVQPVTAMLVGMLAGGMGLRDTRIDRVARTVTLARSPAIATACADHPGMMRIGYDVVKNAPDPTQVMLVNAVRAALSTPLPAVPQAWGVDAVADPPVLAPMDAAAVIAVGLDEAKAEA